MFMAVHAGVGALAGNLLPQPIVAFTFGVVSHFFLDMIPHGDEVIYQGYVSGTKVRRSQLYVAADGLMTTVVIVSIIAWGNFTSTWSVALGIIGSLLPDLLVGLSMSLRLKRQRGFVWNLKRFQAFHRRNHTLLNKRLSRLRNGDIPLLSGLVIQLLTLFIIIRYVI